MNTVFESQSINAECWRAYFEWRADFGLSDESMRDLLVAIRAELTEKIAPSEGTQALASLARLIEVELEDDRQQRSAA